ncbi:MAG: 16S rRNA (cytosine(1402)-N(4))-methyltransferase [Candidatus Kapabacteria bacterium]|nr:16S rRNA (cytosine(1402)-N(4))-methyltransferase [Candidatus Kapabacteria bacterium]
MKRSTENAVSMVHRLLRSQLSQGDVAIDATVGNGWDTRVLADCVGRDGIVYGFDVQQIALDVARTRLAPDGADVRLMLAGHETMTMHVEPHHHGRVRAVTFNLGYLPGGEKSVTTMAATTIDAIRQALDILMPGGILTIVCYSHQEGLSELRSIEDILPDLSQESYTCIELRFVNQNGNPPVVFVVYRASDSGDLQ